jgi:hypothetical protein
VGASARLGGDTRARRVVNGPRPFIPQWQGCDRCCPITEYEVEEEEEKEKCSLGRAAVKSLAVPAEVVGSQQLWQDFVAVLGHDQVADVAYVVPAWCHIILQGGVGVLVATVVLHWLRRCEKIRNKKERNLAISFVLGKAGQDSDGGTWMMKKEGCSSKDGGGGWDGEQRKTLRESRGSKKLRMLEPINKQHDL